MVAREKGHTTPIATPSEGRLGRVRPGTAARSRKWHPDTRPARLTKRANTRINTGDFSLLVFGIFCEQARVTSCNVALNRCKSLQALLRPLLLPAEIEEILILARKTSARDWAVLCLAFNHGCRVSELAGGSGDGEVKFPPLRLTDIDIKNRQITIRRLKGSLTTVQAFVDLRGKPHLSDSAALQAYLKIRIDDGSGLLFTGQKGPLTRFTLNKMFRGYCEQVSAARVARGLAPIPPTAFKFHSIKHSTAKTMIDNGADVYQVKAHLGHDAISSTERYLVPNQRVAHQYVQRAFGQA